MTAARRRRGDSADGASVRHDGFGSVDGDTGSCSHATADPHRRELANRRPMSSHFWWYVARAGGLVAWGLVVASCTWGLLHALRSFGRRPSPSWMLSTHRYLSTLAIVFVGVHVVAILADSYVQFSLADVLVPMVSSWHPVAVGVGHRRHVPARRGGGHVAGAGPALTEGLAGRAPAELRAPRRS